MTEKDDGGNAFPTIKYEGHGDDRYEVHLSGMTLRDYFAAKAMAVMITDTLAPQYPHSEPNVDESEVARFSYQYADSMLAERSK